MKQHPVPQHIASYQFRLIGQMTLKQFLELAGGLVIAWIFYSLDIPDFIKWPMVIFSGLGGAALAFLPIGEIPLDKWITNFIKSIYSPSQYLWKKQNKPPAILLYSAAQKATKPDTKKKVAKKETVGLKEYLETLPETKTLTEVDKQQQQKLIKISSLLGVGELALTPIDIHTKNLPPSFPITKALGTRIRRLGSREDVPVPQSKDIKIEKKPLKKEPIKTAPATTKPTVKPAPPLAPPILVESRFQTKLDPSVAAQFSTTLPIPQTPNVPNLIVGMVLNDVSKIVPGAIIEIIDLDGETARALKTNKLGQFFSSKPLDKGKYQIKTEHPNYVFDIMELKAEGKIIPPIKIKAKKRKEI